MVLLKGLILFIALFLSCMLVSYKISAILRLTKFEQEETPKEAYGAVITMIIISALWALFYILNQY